MYPVLINDEKQRGHSKKGKEIKSTMIAMSKCAKSKGERYISKAKQNHISKNSRKSQIPQTNEMIEKHTHILSP